jgi:hypothetical protein
MIPVLPHAQAYVRAGLSCFPIAYRSKRPWFSRLPRSETGEPTWHPFEERLPTEQEVADWFGDLEPANVAIIGGPVSGNLCILDFDDPTKFNSLLQHEPQLALETKIAKTGRASGGYHVYLRFENPVPKSVAFYPDQWEETKTGKRLRRFGLDVQGTGGYVVAPPSMHESGGVYQWYNPEVRKIAVYPNDWFKDLAGKLGFTLQAKSLGQNGTRGWVSDLIRQGAGQGTRNVQASKLAGFMRNHVPQDIGQAIMELWNEHRVDPPLSPIELERTVASVYRYNTQAADDPGPDPLLEEDV